MNRSAQSKKADASRQMKPRREQRRKKHPLRCYVYQRGELSQFELPQNATTNFKPKSCDPYPIRNFSPKQTKSSTHILRHLTLYNPYRIIKQPPD
jgi:hypothetical protein